MDKNFVLVDEDGRTHVYTPGGVHIVLNPETRNIMVYSQSGRMESFSVSKTKFDEKLVELGVKAEKKVQEPA